MADGITSYEPDQVKTSLTEGDIVAIYSATDKKFLFGSSAQNLGFDDDTKAFVASNSGWLFKVEKQEGHYLFHLQTPAGQDYSIWGNPGYMNAQSTTGANYCCFILGLVGDNKDHTLGQDLNYGAAWDIESSGNGFKLKNVGTGLYLGNGKNGDGSKSNANVSSENATVWTFCTLKEKTLENPIAVGSYDATDANTADFANFKTISGDATYDAETKVFTKTCGWEWDGDGLDLSRYRYIVITAGSSRDQAGDGYMTITDNNGVTIGGDDYGEGNQNMWFSTWNHLFCCKIDLEKLRSEKTFDIRHIKKLTIDGGNYFMLGTAFATNTEHKTVGTKEMKDHTALPVLPLTSLAKSNCLIRLLWLAPRFMRLKVKTRMATK